MASNLSAAAKPAVVLLSGGLDSATALAVARRDGFACHALTVAYGQRHAAELGAAARVARALGAVDHRVTHLDLRLFGGSALTADVAVPKDRPHEAISTGIPVTYVPARNTVFLSLALAWAEVLGSFDIFIGVNSLDYSVSGDTRVWVRTRRWAKLLRVEDLYHLPANQYQTVAVDPVTLKVGWRRVTGRFRHATSHKRCFRLRLERGQEITVTEDHSLFTIDPGTARLTTVKGADVFRGMPLVVPFDLSGAARAWTAELPSLDLTGLPEACASRFQRRSIVFEVGWITNRLRRTRLPVHFPVTDEFLYIVGLWLAEGGKEPEAKTTTLRFSVGGIPGAVGSLRSFFGQYGVAVSKSPANEIDYSVSSSVVAALFRHLGLFGTAKSGGKKFPEFFWRLSQRQRRVVIAGLWDGDGSHVFNGEAVLAQKSHQLVHDTYHCLVLDGIFPHLKDGRHSQKHLLLSRAGDFRKFVRLYPLRHHSKRESYTARGSVAGRDKTTGLWKCPGVWSAIAGAVLPAGAKTRAYNAGGKYDQSVRARRSAFAGIPALRTLVDSKLAFLRVTDIEEVRCLYMYDLSVEGSENFVANGILAHNSGYPDCRPEFVAAFERLANLATKAGVEGKGQFRVHAPLVQMSKADIIRLGVALGVDYGLTHSCYDPAPDGAACGRCDSCQLRRDGFRAAGVPDPTRYAPPVVK